MLNILDKSTSDDVYSNEYNSVKEQEVDAVKSTGQTPINYTIGVLTADPNVQQLSIAMAIHAAGGNFYIDSGIVNAYVLGVQTISGTPMRAPNAYFNGMTCGFVATNTNTGVSTVNVAGLGIKTIKKTQWTADVIAGDIESGKKYDIVYSIATGFFELVPALTFPITEIQGGTGLISYTAGDFIYADGSNSLAKRGIGSAGDVVTSSGGFPVWSTPTKIIFVDTNVVNNQAIPGSWADVNLSSVVGSNIAFVFLRITFLGGAGVLLARTNGETADVGKTTSSDIGAGAGALSGDQDHIGYISLKTDSAGIIEVEKTSGSNYSLDVITYIK